MASFLAALESFETGIVIVLVIEKQSPVITRIHNTQIAISAKARFFTFVSILSDSSSASAIMLFINSLKASSVLVARTILLFSISCSAAVALLAVAKEATISVDAWKSSISPLTSWKPFCMLELYWSRYSLKISNFVFIPSNSSFIVSIVSCCFCGSSL